MPKPPLRNTLKHFLDDRPGEELEEARLLPLDLIIANPHQSRQMFVDATLAELAESIRTQGVLQPILVRPVGDKFEIVAGERRTRAAFMVGLTEIPALVREMSDVEAALATATENLQREDLDLEDEARQYQYLMQLLDVSGRELATRLGKGRDYVNRRLAVLQHPHLFQQIREGQLTLNQALAHIAALNQLPGRVTVSDEGIAVTLGASLREEDSNNAGYSDEGYDDEDVAVTRQASLREGNSSTGTERAVLDNPHPAPTAFRWRPLQTFDTWLAQTPPTSVPPDERASVRVQVASMRAKLDAWERALGEE